MSSDPNKLPVPKDCLFYAHAETGYVFQHLIGAMCQMKPEKGHMRWNITPQGIHMQMNIPSKRKSTSTKTAPHEAQVDGALLDSYLLCNKFQQFECKHDMNIEINAKNLNDQIKTIKRKERMILYILNKKPYEELVIFSESTIAKPRPEHGISRVKVTVTMGLFYTKDVEPIEFKVDSHGESIAAYGPKITVPPNIYDRVKKLGSKGQLSVKIQGSDYIAFMVSNKQIFSKEVCWGTYNEKAEVYDGIFELEYFSVISHLAKIKTDLLFFAPLTKGHPIKIEIALDLLGESTMYVKDNHTIHNELSFKIREAGQ